MLSNVILWDYRLNWLESLDMSSILALHVHFLVGKLGRMGLIWKGWVEKVSISYIY